jgi:hypothetical protein
MLDTMDGEPQDTTDALQAGEKDCTISSVAPEAGHAEIFVAQGGDRAAGRHFD